MRKARKSLVAVMLVTLLLASTSILFAAGQKDASPAAQGSGLQRPQLYSTFPATGTQAHGARKLGELIEDKSQGLLKMEFYPSSQLGDKIASMEGLRAGTIEMTECAATDLSNYNSMWSTLSLPYLFRDPAQAIATLTDPAVSSILEADAASHGFVIIAWANLGSRSVLNTKRPVYTPNDMKGLRVRVMEDPVLANSLNAMGGAATPLPWSEVYTALQQGTIEGLENSAPVILANKMEEVAKYYSLTEQFIIPDPVFVSKVMFDSLSKEDQQALLDAGKAFEDAWNNDIWAKAMQSALQTMETNGVKINQVDKAAFGVAVKPVIDKFLSTATADQKKLYSAITSVKDKY